mgnify:CR=1 FL=1
MSPYAIPGAYPKTYEAPKSPPGGMRPKIIKKPDFTDKTSDHSSEKGTSGATLGLAAAGGVAAGVIGTVATAEYLE